jgi:hypothetical protein
MRLFVFSALALLGACASPPPPASSPPVARSAAPAAAVRLPDVSDVAAAFARAGSADAPTLDQSLAMVGKPDLERRDGLGIFQTYRLEPCALLLAFATDSRGVQRLQRAEAGVRRAGDPPPDRATCFAAAAARGRAASR